LSSREKQVHQQSRVNNRHKNKRVVTKIGTRQWTN